MKISMKIKQLKKRLIVYKKLLVFITMAIISSVNAMERKETEQNDRSWTWRLSQEGIDSVNRFIDDAVNYLNEASELLLTNNGPENERKKLRQH